MRKIGREWQRSWRELPSIEAAGGGGGGGGGGGQGGEGEEQQGGEEEEQANRDCGLGFVEKVR